MLELDWPWVLLALPLPWLARRLMPAPTTADGAALRIPGYAEVRRLTVDRPKGACGHGGRLISAWVIWLLLLLAAARPQWLGEAVELPQQGRDILLAVDLSKSMEHADFELDGRRSNRLDVVKAVASRFIERRHGDRLGLILFGERAYLQTPLTFDTHTVATMLASAEIGLAGNKTAIGDAIGLAVKRLREGADDQRILVVLTDGANTAGAVDPRQAARLAQQEGLRIYTIGLGAERMRVPSLFGSRMINPSVDLDEPLLQQIATSTGGRYFRARDTRSLEQIYRELDRLEPKLSDSEVFRPLRTLFHWPLTLALVLSILLCNARLGVTGLPVRTKHRAPPWSPTEERLP